MITMLIYRTAAALSKFLVVFIILFLLAGILSQGGCTRRDKDAVDRNQLLMHKHLAQGTSKAIQGYRGTQAKRSAPVVTTH